MPIRFRCTHCTRRLGIATRKAGTETTCPHCGGAVVVPANSGDAKTEHLNLDDIEEMLGNVATERIVKPAAQLAQPVAALLTALPAPALENEESAASHAPKSRMAPPPVPKPAVKAPPKSDERPLFERDMDELLGLNEIPKEPERPAPARVSGPDAMSLGEPPRVIVLNPQQATLLTGAMVVMLGIAFAAGYFAGR
ncbi:unnamed protein product [Gemmata massiliana]|uniref:Uncharacterized protein n=1 Tax=Gemmata massiliana TaxID=1210884 RepID=A0A6P2D644_9BACT|nr:hypothetical protein [Gemmata massiliana]VTR94942.1 unnamed protein product [Gemmata massiliana]